MKVSFETTIVAAFYVALIVVLINLLMNVLNSPIAFEEHKELDDTKVWARKKYSGQKTSHWKNLQFANMGGMSHPNWKKKKIGLFK